MDLTKNENNFLPAIKIHYAYASEVSEIIDNVDGTVQINFNSGMNWKLFYANRDSIKFIEPAKHVDEGVLYNQTLEFKNPGDDPVKSIIIEELVNSDLIIKIDFINGKSKLLGDVDNPAKLISNFKYGDLKTARSIKITRLSNFPVPYIS